VPPLLDDAARAAFDWRTIDEELAELMHDSAASEEEAGAVLVRSGGGPRQLSFEAEHLGIELEVTNVGERERRFAGQLLPPAPARVTFELAGFSEEAVTVQADELGRFVLDRFRAGIMRLRVGSVAIPWINV
jgi:hypothetical protein